MSFQLAHPGTASVDCAACHKWVYDLDTGKLATYFDGERDVPQPRVVAPPCRRGYGCAKISPEHFAATWKMWDRNADMLDAYRRFKASGETGCGGRPDYLQSLAFALLDDLFSRQRERDGRVNLEVALARVLR